MIKESKERFCVSIEKDIIDSMDDYINYIKKEYPREITSRSIVIQDALEYFLAVVHNKKKD